MQHQLICKGCGGVARRMFILLRPPRAPNEKRICKECLPQLEADGWITLWTFVPLPGGQPHAFLCWECQKKDDLTFRIVSLTGEPVELERCEGCYDDLRKEGWRAASVRGTS